MHKEPQDANNGFMVRFVHISDLHFAPLPPVSWRHLFNKRLIGYINWRMNRSAAMGAEVFPALVAHIKKQHYQHLAITGDLVNLALPQEFSNARAKLRELGDSRDVSVVFGNHDAYIPGAFAEACAVFAPWIQSDSDIEKFSADKNTPPRGFGSRKGKSLKTEQAEKALINQSWRYSAENYRQNHKALPLRTERQAFPYMRVRGSAAFIGVSSAAAMPPFFANGIFDKNQAAALAYLLRLAQEKALFRIIMIHHPPLGSAAAWNKSLWGIKRFRQIVADYGAELILHGHTHLPTLSYMPGKPDKGNPQGRAAVVGVSSASQSFGRHKPPAGYNVFAADKAENGRWECLLQRFVLAGSDNKIRRSLCEKILG